MPAEVIVEGRSLDDGATWERIETPYPGSYFGAVAPADGSLLIFGLRGKDGKLRDGAVPVSFCVEKPTSLVGEPGVTYNRLRIGGEGVSLDASAVWRRIDLSGAATATLSASRHGQRKVREMRIATDDVLIVRKSKGRSRSDTEPERAGAGHPPAPPPAWNGSVKLTLVAPRAGLEQPSAMLFMMTWSSGMPACSRTTGDCIMPWLLITAPK